MMRTPANSDDGLAFYAQLINAMPGKHLVLLPNAPAFTVAAVSDEYLVAFGIERDSLVGRGVFDAFFDSGGNETVADQLRQSLNLVTQTRQTHHMADQRHEWPDAQTGRPAWRVWRSVNKPVVGSGEQLLCIIHTIEDITQQVQLVEVAQANQYLQTIINLFKEPLQVLQPVLEQGEIVDFRFNLTNQAYAAYANATPEQLQGKRVGEVFPGYFETVSFTNPVETYKTGRPLTFEIHYDKDGLDLYNVMSTFKLDDEVVIHFTDFTEVRQLQFQLERKIEELNRTNDNLKQFAYIASHDLQEPLRKIQSFSSLLVTQLDGQLTETSRTYLQRINNAGARMSMLIKDLLSFSRISIHQQNFASVSLDTVVADALTTLELEISQRNAKITIRPLPVITGSASQLGQLFQNLLSNALKFSRHDVPPCVDVASTLLARSELPPTIRPTEQAAFFHQISVRDEGIGIESQYIERIFQVFQRLHSEKDYAGTGVGLAICQRVVENHGGAITATSEPGKGSTFWIYLPA